MTRRLIGTERLDVMINNLTKEDLKKGAEIKALADSLKAETELKLEFKRALDD